MLVPISVGRDSASLRISKSVILIPSWFLSNQGPPLRPRSSPGTATRSGQSLESLNVMHVDAPSDGPPSLTEGAAPTAGCSISPLAREVECWDRLSQILGESYCRKLGLFRIPKDLTLSVVIPVYNERATIREILRRGGRPHQRGDHRGG